MAYLDLSNDAMIAVSEPWVTAGEVRKRIEQYEPLRGLLPVVKRAHDAVFALTTRKVVGEHADKLAELTKDAVETDVRHDRAIRGAIAILDAAAYVVGDEKLRASIVADRQELYPAGPSMTQVTYGEESGAALALKKKLDADSKLAKRITRVRLVIEQAKGPALSFSVAELVEQQIAAGKQLSEIELLRRKLEAGAPLAGDKQRSSSAVSRARTAWIRATGLLVDTANELDDVGEEDRRAIFGALAKALESVERRPATEDTDDGEEKPSEPKA